MLPVVFMGLSCHCFYVVDLLVPIRYDMMRFPPFEHQMLDTVKTLTDSNFLCHLAFTCVATSLPLVFLYTKEMLVIYTNVVLLTSYVAVNVFICTLDGRGEPLYLDLKSHCKESLLDSLIW